MKTSMQGRSDEPIGNHFRERDIKALWHLTATAGKLLFFLVLLRPMPVEAQSDIDRISRKFMDGSLWGDFHSAELHWAPNEYQIGLTASMGYFVEHEFTFTIFGHFDDHRSGAVHEFELERSVGIGLAWKYFLKSKIVGPFVGFRTDLVHQGIWWEDMSQQTSRFVTGNSVQPLLIGGWRFAVGKNTPPYFDFFGTFGYEFVFPVDSSYGQSWVARVGASIVWKDLTLTERPRSSL